MFDLVKITMYFYISGEKNTLKVTKNSTFCLKGEYEPQYLNIRTIDNSCQIEHPKCS